MRRTAIPCRPRGLLVAYYSLVYFSNASSAYLAYENYNHNPVNPCQSSATKNGLRVTSYASQNASCFRRDQNHHQYLFYSKPREHTPWNTTRHIVVVKNPQWKHACRSISSTTLISCSGALTARHPSCAAARQSLS